MSRAQSHDECRKRSCHVGRRQAGDAESLNCAALDSESDGIYGKERELGRAVRPATDKPPTDCEHAEDGELNEQRTRHRAGPNRIGVVRGAGEARSYDAAGDEARYCGRGMPGETAVGVSGGDTEQHKVSRHDAGECSAEREKSDRIDRARVQRQHEDQRVSYVCLPIGGRTRHRNSRLRGFKRWPRQLWRSPWLGSLCEMHKNITSNMCMVSMCLPIRAAYRGTQPKGESRDFCAAHARIGSTPKGWER